MHCEWWRGLQGGGLQGGGLRGGLLKGSSRASSGGGLGGVFGT
jgi:hypothetical protein